MSLLGAPYLSNAALTAIAEQANLRAFGLEGEPYPARRSHLPRAVQTSPIHGHSREQPADGRQLAGAVLGLAGPALAPRRRVSQADRCQRQSLRQPGEPAAPQPLTLQQVAVGSCCTRAVLAGIAW